MIVDAWRKGRSHMADLSDVEAALVEAIISASTAGGPFPVLAANQVRVYRGHPPTTGLVGDRLAGIVNITIFPVANATRNTTRWLSQDATVQIAGGLSATASGQTASFAGSALAGELAGVLVNDVPYVYRAQADDSAGLVAAILADKIRSTQICWLVGSSLTIPGATSVVARTTGVATVLRECRRQEQDILVTVWAGTPQARDAVCAAVDSAPYTDRVPGIVRRQRRTNEVQVNCKLRR